MMSEQKKLKPKTTDINKILTNGAKAITKRKARSQSSSRSLANRFSESNYFSNRVLKKQDIAALIMGKKGKLKSSIATSDHLKNSNWQQDIQSEQETGAEDEDNSEFFSYTSSKAFHKRKLTYDKVLSCEIAVERVKNSHLYFKYIPMIKEQYEQILNTEIKNQYLTRFEKLNRCITSSQTVEEKYKLCKFFRRHKELNTTLWEYASIPPEFNFEEAENNEEDFRLTLSDLNSLHDTDKEYYSDQLLACSMLSETILPKSRSNSNTDIHTEVKVEKVIENNQCYSSSDLELDMTGIYEIEDSDDGMSEPLFPQANTITQGIGSSVSEGVTTTFSEKSNLPFRVYNDTNDDIIVTNVTETKNKIFQTPSKCNSNTSNVSKASITKDNYTSEEIIEIIEIPGTPSPQNDRLSLRLLSKDLTDATDTYSNIQQINDDELFYRRQKQDFSKLSLKELKKQMDDWGFKPCRSRAENIEILNSCNVYLPIQKAMPSLKHGQQRTAKDPSEVGEILGEITNTHTNTTKKLPKTIRQIEALSTGDLKSLVVSFGFKPVRSRTEMIELVKECCLKDNCKMPKGSLNHIKKTSINSEKSTANSTISSSSGNSPAGTLVESVYSAETTQVDLESPSQVLETEDLDGKISQRISEALKTQEYFNEIWVKILTYQPLDLEEFCKSLNTRLTMYLSTKFVREWCDKHGITTTTANSK